MDAEATNDRRVLALWALALFVVGLLMPFLIALFAPSDAAIGFGVVAELLALLFGTMGWRHLAGKVATIGVALLLVIAAINYVFYTRAVGQGAADIEARYKKAELNRLNR